MFLGSVGVLRMPDLFLRMHASTKSATLGVLLIMSGVAIHFGDLTVTARTAAVVVFIFLTVPISAHMIGRAAYRSGIPLWENTLSDELKGYIDGEQARDEAEGERDSEELLPRQQADGNDK